MQKSYLFLTLFVIFFSVGCTSNSEKKRLEEEKVLNEQLKDGWLDWEPKDPAYDNMPEIKK